MKSVKLLQPMDLALCSAYAPSVGLENVEDSMS